jgi:hypothetical protein
MKTLFKIKNGKLIELPVIKETDTRWFLDKNISVPKEVTEMNYAYETKELAIHFEIRRLVKKQIQITNQIQKWKKEN